PRLHPYRGVLAQSAGRLVAALPVGGVRRTELRRSARDRTGNARRHETAQCPRQAVDLGPPAQAASPPPAPLLLLSLRNGALPSFVISGVNAHEYRHYTKVGLPHIACADADAARIHNYLPASTCPKMTKEGLDSRYMPPLRPGPGAPP